MQAAVQVTVLEYVEGFFKKFSAKAYGRTPAANAKAGAEVFMGMLKLVLSKGGREELRLALHCFKDQLQAAASSSPPVRAQQVEELFALLSALVDAAERLKQFSPVKETLSCSVLEEVRWRLFRILAGDGFADDVDLRRRALDIVFAAYHREAASCQASLQRLSKLAAAGAGAGAGAGPAAAGSTGRGRLGSRAPLTGPDITSWEGLWHSLASMPGKRMMPLLQSVMLDLYIGKTIPGSPAAIAAAAAAAGGVNGSSSSSSSKKGSSSNGSVSAVQQAVAPVQQQQSEASELAALHDQQQQQQQPKGSKQGSKLELVKATVVADVDGGAHDGPGSPWASDRRCSDDAQQPDGSVARLSQLSSCHASDVCADDADDAAAAAADCPASSVGRGGGGGGTPGGLRGFVGALKGAAASGSGSTGVGIGGGGAKPWVPKSWVQFHNNLRDRVSDSANKAPHAHHQDNGSASLSDGSTRPDTAAASFCDEEEPNWAASSGGGAGIAIACGSSSAAAGGMLAPVQAAAKT